MKKTALFMSVAAIAAAGTFSIINAQDNEMSFFITSVGKGDGANYGGLAGADAYCAQMATAGQIPTPPGRTWRQSGARPRLGWA